MVGDVELDDITWTIIKCINLINESGGMLMHYAILESHCGSNETV